MAVSEVLTQVSDNWNLVFLEDLVDNRHHLLILLFVSRSGFLFNITRLKFAFSGVVTLLVLVHFFIYKIIFNLL